MKRNLSKPNLLKTQIVILAIEKGITLETELEIIQNKLNERFDTFYLQDEIEEEILDIIAEERKEQVVLIPEQYVM